jgi:hypothetical protein
MLIDFILQATQPTSQLPTDWALYIIGGLVAFILFIFGIIKWLIGLMSTKADTIVGDFKSMHREGITELGQCKEALLRHEIKVDSAFSEIKTDQKETKYAIQTLNTKIQCKGNE